MQNSNYYKMMEEQIAKYDSTSDQSAKPKMLLHCCCAPCSSHCLSVLAEHFDITAYFYNPNITDYAEYIKRFEELSRFVHEVYVDGVDVKLADHDPQVFLDMAKGREELPERGARCYDCYKIRLEKSASYAKENGYDVFTTTLSISPHKNADWLNEIGAEMSRKYDIGYLFSDFKKKDGYRHSIQLSKEYGLYRQNFCGCEFSRKAAESRDNRKQG